MSDPSKLLVIGGFSAGKTHFGAQLLSRLQSRSCAYWLREASPNLTLLEEALARLSEGMTTSHTSRDLFGTIILPIVNARGDEADVVWPEFGGEQVDDFVTTRHISAEWIKRVEEADSWILMLRLMRLRTDDDLVSKPLETVLAGDSSKENPAEHSGVRFSWSAQSRCIELLQMLLYFKAASLYSRLSTPRLTVLLSCWDELGKSEGAIPIDVLQDYLPMFTEFLKATWETNRLSVYGLSALSRPLRSDVVDEEFRRLGPEKFGYVIQPDGQKSRDLTLPLKTALGV